MKNKVNLFSHLSKELSTDSFLMWLFHYIDVDQQLQPMRDSFFETLVFRPEDYGKTVSDLQARRKEKKWERESDIVLDFKLDGELKTVLFETRISPLTTLSGYKSIYPNLYTCVYLKDQPVSHQERRLAEKHGYLVRDINVLMSALIPLSANSSIILQYCQYLEDLHQEPLQDVRSTNGNFKSDDFYRLRSKYLKFA